MKKKPNKDNNNWKTKFFLFISYLVPVLVAIISCAGFNKSAWAASRTPPSGKLIAPTSERTDSNRPSRHHALISSATFRRQVSKLNAVPFEVTESKNLTSAFQQAQKTQTFTVKMQATTTIKRTSFSRDDNQRPKDEFKKMFEVFSNPKRSFLYNGY